VFLAILVGNRLAVFDMCFQGRIHDELFADGMTGQCPNKLVLITGLLIFIIAVDNTIVVILQLAVIALDEPCDALGAANLGKGDDASLLRISTNKGLPIET
jgi:hypothetical protein